MKESALRVQDALTAERLELEVREFPASTRTAAEAAQAIGCEVAAIAKSIVFRGRESGGPILAVASGAHRIDLEKLAKAAGEAPERADADFVREKTGFAIGGVPPIAHKVPPVTVIDESLMALPEIWAAAGTPNAVFRLTPNDLLRLTGGKLADLKP